MKTVLYSGKLDEAYGIRILLDAFSLIREEDLQLYVTGSGKLEGLLQEKAEKDCRIHFFGLLGEREKVLIMEREADVLVNPRLPSSPLSHYSFPSKLFEYLLSGTPVVSFHISGIPEDYWPFLMLAEEETPKALSSAIRSAMHLTEEERHKRGEAAKNFILKEKSPRAGAEKIWGFVRSL